MAFIDYYKILGVDRNIPQKDVRAAYRKRAKQFHPDLHPNDPKAKAKFQALSEAYDVIGDPEKRKNMTNMENNGAMQRPLRMPKEADLEEVRLLKDLTLAVLAVGEDSVLSSAICLDREPVQNLQAVLMLKETREK